MKEPPFSTTLQLPVFTILLIRFAFILLGVSSVFSCQAPIPNRNAKGFDSIAPLEIEYTGAVRFINDYVSFLAERNSEMGFMEWVKQRSDVSKNFKFELKRILADADTEPPGLGFEPLINSYL